jgi:hypothetical protein
MDLTIKQEKFCHLFIQTGNASEAYRGAYNAGKMKPESVNRRAKECTDNSKIAARITELQAEHRKAHDVTVEGMAWEFEELARKAVEAGQFGPAVTAKTKKAELFGLFKDHNRQQKSETTVVTNVIPPVLREMMEFPHDAKTTEE